MLITAIAIQPLFFLQVERVYIKASANRQELPAIKDHVSPLFTAKSTISQISIAIKLRQPKPYNRYIFFVLCKNLFTSEISVGGVSISR